MPRARFPAVVNLATLNGQTAITFIGDNSGYSVSRAGDVNGGGVADIIIGALGNNGNAEVSYVVFGHASAWTTPIFLASLNGTNGFTLIGENRDDAAGYSVSTAGDVNGDGVDDIIIGAPYAGNQTGFSHVVFGHQGNWPASFSLSSLNGRNGFQLRAENIGDYAGTVGTAGDVNGDGLTDIIIGTLRSNNQVGASYVVFGHKGAWVTPFSLSSLNGTNGFKLTGDACNTGRSVGGSAGDVNGDGLADIIIGAPNTNAGVSYVVFGHQGNWPASFSLSNLNGTNGFQLRGENMGDASGSSVNTAGDINGDGVGDMIIGAPNANNPAFSNNAGASYVVFGQTGAWSTPFSLSSLNGANGFKLSGENAGDASGFFVNTAGDMNGDGVGDIIIGAYGFNKQAGASYVVFGHVGNWTNPLSLSSLNGMNGFKLTGENAGDQSGFFVSTAGDVNGDGITDIIIGTYNFNNPSSGRSYVVFGENSIVVTLTNSLMLQKGSTLLLNNRPFNTEVHH